MPRSLYLFLVNNARGSSPIANLYNHVVFQYPELGLTAENSVIRLLQRHWSRNTPARTRLVISPRNDLSVKHVFHYDRFLVQDYIAQTVFTESDFSTVTALGSAALLEYLANKVNQNLTAEDFFVEPDGITYCGGSVGPNWRLKARPDSVFWYGETILRLHA